MEIQNDLLIKSILGSFVDSETELNLSPEEDDMISSLPNALSKLHSDLAKATLLHHFPAILSAIINKAKNGDTAAAKFIAEFVQPEETQTINGSSEPAQWETLALAIRDRVGVELSAVEVVVRLLQTVGAYPDTTIRTMLLGSSITN